MTKQNLIVGVDVYPDSGTDVFRIGAADDILRLLADAHESEFTIPELVAATDVTRSTVWRAVDLLDSIGVVRVRKTPQQNYVSINPDRLDKDDPVLGISQSTFREPIRAFVDRVETVLNESDEGSDLLGVVVFGSVARGEADRRSDIDLFVVVDGDRTAARRVVSDVVSELETKRFDGDRFAFEPYVESEASARRATEKLGGVFDEGITVYGSDELDTLRRTVIGDE